jgi:RNA polymerase sigma-70 factor (ECF subfamily)
VFSSSKNLVRLNDGETSAEMTECCPDDEQAALRVIYETHKDKVYSMALYFFHGDAATASDVTQQVFLKVLTDLHRFRGESAFSTWLYRLVANTCIDTARRLRWRILPIEKADWVAAGTCQDDRIAQTELAQAIQMALSSLPPKFRIAIVLRYFEELSYEDMAKVLNCSVGTVASRLSRGHRILAEKLAPYKDWVDKGS